MPRYHFLCDTSFHVAWMCDMNVRKELESSSLRTPFEAGVDEEWAFSAFAKRLSCHSCGVTQRVNTENLCAAHVMNSWAFQSLWASLGSWQILFSFFKLAVFYFKTLLWGVMTLARLSKISVLVSSEKRCVCHWVKCLTVPAHTFQRASHMSKS